MHDLHPAAPVTQLARHPPPLPPARCPTRRLPPLRCRCRTAALAVGPPAAPWRPGTRAPRGCWRCWTTPSGPSAAYARRWRSASWPTGGCLHLGGGCAAQAACSGTGCSPCAGCVCHHAAPAPAAFRTLQALTLTLSLWRCSDNLRGFFEQCFPTLLKRLFGYDGTSWLTLVAQVRAPARRRACQGLAPSTPRPAHLPATPPHRAALTPHPSPLPQSPKEADARALLRLLSPSGPLFTAMYSADADGATQFFFPRERLPTHTQVGGHVMPCRAAQAEASCCRQAVACVHVSALGR